MQLLLLLIVIAALNIISGLVMLAKNKTRTRHPAHHRGRAGRCCGCSSWQGQHRRWGPSG
jgi:hypothetical protein